MPNKTKKRTKQFDHEESDAAVAQGLCSSEQASQLDSLDVDSEQRAAQQNIAANWRFCCFALETIYNTPAFQAIAQQPSGSGALQSSSAVDGDTDLVPKIGEVFLNCWQAFQASSKASTLLFSSLMQQQLKLNAECHRLAEEQRSISAVSGSQEANIQTLNNQIAELIDVVKTKDMHIESLQSKLCPAQEKKRFKAWAEQKIKPTVMSERQMYLKLLKNGDLKQLQSKLELGLDAGKAVPMPHQDDPFDVLPELDSIFEELDILNAPELAKLKPN